MSIEQTATTRRVTRPRLLITQVLAELSRFATAQEITDILRERGTRIGTATAYRNVQMMASQGELDVIHVNGEALYRECSDQHHHHHIVCHECGRTIEIEIPGLEQWIDKAAKQLKYQTIAHELEIFDLCPKCAAKHAIEPPLSVGTSPKDGPLTTPDTLIVVVPPIFGLVPPPPIPGVDTRPTIGPLPTQNCMRSHCS